MEHHAFHVPYLLDTTPEAAFHGQAVKTVVYLRVSTTQQVLGPEARTPEGLAGRLTARWQGGRNPALPRTGRFQDRHRQVWTCPVPPSTAHEHPRAQAEPLACISTRILSVPYFRTFSLGSDIRRPIVDPFLCACYHAPMSACEHARLPKARTGSAQTPSFHPWQSK